MQEPVPHPVFACVGLGSNVGDRRSHIEAGLVGLNDLAATTLVYRSSIIETEPVGPPGQGPYLNAAACIETTLGPRQLLNELLNIEQARGRDRSQETRWGARTLDLDLLLYSDQVIDEPGLRVPHPRLAERLFVLEPLAEIAGGVVLPGTGPGSGRTVLELLQVLRAQRRPAHERGPGGGGEEDRDGLL